MNSAEFKMITDLAEVTPKSLDFNFEEIKSFLSDNLSIYKGLVVTEEQIKDASAIKSKINKVATAIREHRIAIKKEYEKPYEEFKEKCDELESMCKEVSSAIGSQLDAFEEKRKAEKRKVLEDYFEGKSTEDSKPYLKFDDIFDNRWLNKTFDENEAKEIIDGKIAETETAVNAIRNLNSEFTFSLLEYYKQTHDLMFCINKNKELTELKQAEEKKASEEKARMLVKEVERTADREFAEKKVEANLSGVADVDEVVNVAFRVICTRGQLARLKEFLIENNIKYGKA